MLPQSFVSFLYVISTCYRHSESGKDAVRGLQVCHTLVMSEVNLNFTPRRYKRNCTF
jgi:hypothetical protein